MKTIRGTEIWVPFGVGNYLSYIPAHQIVSQLRSRPASALPNFHAFTGCDAVSSFAGRGTGRAMESLASVPRGYICIGVFLSLSRGPAVLAKSCLKPLGRCLVVLQYCKTSRMVKVNEARQHQFFKRCRGLEIIPPTQTALSCTFCVCRFGRLRIS